MKNIQIILELKLKIATINKLKFLGNYILKIVEFLDINSIDN